MGAGPTWKTRTRSLASEQRGTGLTSNSTIFENAIRSGRSYDAPIVADLTTGNSGEELLFDFDSALEDITWAAGLFRPIYDLTNTVDGWFSLDYR